MEQNEAAKSNHEKKNPGSIDFPFQLGIIGGGPAGTSIIVRTIHLGFFDELCNGKFDASASHSDCANVAGVCMFDRNPVSRVGGGRLQDYVVS